jgi:hypothetical protein
MTTMMKTTSLFLTTIGLALFSSVAFAQERTELRSADGSVLYAAVGLRSTTANQWTVPTTAPLYIDVGARGNVRGIELPVRRTWDLTYRGSVIERGSPGTRTYPLNQHIKVLFANFGEVDVQFVTTISRTGRDAIGFVVTPSWLGGVTTYSARFRSPRVNQDFSSVATGTRVRIEDEDFVRDRDLTTTIRVQYGIVRPDAFTFVIEHDHGKTFQITPDTSAGHATFAFTKMIINYTDTSYAPAPERLPFTLANPVYNVFIPVAPRPFPPPPPFGR